MADNPFAELSPPYATIVADPPWQYRKSQQSSDVQHSRRYVSDLYSTLTMDEIAALPVATLAADDAHLYLWVTNPRLFNDRNDLGGTGPIDIMHAWGFRYITTLTWVKRGAPGMGSYFRIDTEHVLFGVRGHCPIPPANRVSNVIEAKKRGHSEKPDQLFSIVEAVSPGPYLELFARAPHLGWDSWGHGYELSRAVTA